MLLSPTGKPVPRVLTAVHAHLIGFTTKRIETELSHGRWQQLARGLYLTRVDRPTRFDWIAAGLLAAGGDGVVSGWDAVRARGIGGERPPVDHVLIVTASGTNRLVGQARLRPSSRPITATRLTTPDEHIRVPMAATARAVADTSLDYRRFDPVRALVTSAVQRRLCTPEELEAELEGGPQNGSAHLRRALEDVFRGVESISEAELADLLDRNGLPEAEFNIPIVTWDGLHVADADALWRPLRAALEVDSRRHHFYEDDWTNTMSRHNRLTTRRLSITHYPPKAIRNRGRQVATEIGEWLRERAAELDLPYPPPPPRPATGRNERTPFVLPRPAA